MGKERVSAAPVAVGFIRNPKSELLLVGRLNLLTLPTGHMKPGEKSLKETLVREMVEELSIKPDQIKITESLGTLFRDNGSGLKVFEIFSCKIGQGTADEVRYKEDGEVIHMWLTPAQAIRSSALDPLAREAISMFIKKYPRYTGPQSNKEGSWRKRDLQDQGARGQRAVNF
ncbi:MAG: NUDIX hydrolase [Candidatus Portnoybacteria bacterium]|nr:NUDIX hydrolase [Candidatus Portnoybacteria bacterium]